MAVLESANPILGWGRVSWRQLDRRNVEAIPATFSCRYFFILNDLLYFSGHAHCKFGGVGGCGILIAIFCSLGFRKCRD